MNSYLVNNRLTIIKIFIITYWKLLSNFALFLKNLE